AIFDQTKLLWLSQQYMKTMESLRLAELTEPFIANAGLTVARDRGWLARVVDTLKERAQTLVELVEAGRFYFERPREYEAKAAQKLFTAEGAQRLHRLARRLDRLARRLGEPDGFTHEAIEALYREQAAALGLKLVDLAQLTRLAVTGKTASPPLFEVLALLGRDETLARLTAARHAIGAST